MKSQAKHRLRTVRTVHPFIGRVVYASISSIDSSFSTTLFRSHKPRRASDSSTCKRLVNEIQRCQMSFNEGDPAPPGQANTFDYSLHQQKWEQVQSDILGITITHNSD